MATSELVALCASCETYVGPEEAGGACPMTDCGHKLRLRRGFVCRECEEHPLFLSRYTYDKHREGMHDVAAPSQEGQ